MTRNLILILVAISQFAFGQTKPETIELRNNKKELIVYGSLHLNNPKDSMFIDIEQKLIKLSPDIVLNEGGNWPLHNSKTESIIESGEEGFIKYLCVNNNIPIRTFEPSPQEEFKYILSKYSKSDVLLMYFCRRISNVQNKPNVESFKEEMLEYLSYLKIIGFPIEDLENEYNKVLKHYKLTFKEELDWKSFDSKYVWPDRDFSIINKISTKLTDFRDFMLLESIKNELKHKNKVFVIVGAGHVLRQKEKIIQSFNELTN